MRRGLLAARQWLRSPLGRCQAEHRAKTTEVLNLGKRVVAVFEHIRKLDRTQLEGDLADQRFPSGR